MSAWSSMHACRHIYSIVISLFLPPSHFLLSFQDRLSSYSFPSSNPLISSPCLSLRLIIRNKNSAVQSVLHRQRCHRLSSHLSVRHHPIFSGVFSICFNLLRVLSMSSSDHLFLLRLQVLPRSSASKTSLLLLRASATFRVVCSQLDLGPSLRALHHTRC